jgi:DNA-binding SARP family transcriptional activator
MQLLDAQGDVPEALNVYDRLRRVLRDDLGTYPGEHARALFDRLVGRPAPR